MSSAERERCLERLVSDFLGRLEMEETRLLAWGLVDGCFGYDEVLEHAREFRAGLDGESRQVLDDSFQDLDDLVEYLETQCFLFPLPDDAGYRTRMAESVRLMARLRQLFPKHMRGGAWQTAPTLVSDFRFQLRRREVPRRQTLATEALAMAKESGILESVGQQALIALLGAQSDTPLRLSAFQARSLQGILADLATRRSKATIVCAGTGSGKTLAFYLPALARLADLIDATFWTKCLAIYPRNELLKDQFAEAYRQVRKLDSVLHAAGRRKLRIGNLFGITPRNGSYLQNGCLKEWPRVGNGFQCPFMRCPRCGAVLVWHAVDIEANPARERLNCLADCGMVVTEDEIVLTRERMQKEPPDLLFTTTEMLNQRLGDSSMRHLFGVGKCIRKKPELLLLDEAHTYAGLQGAHTALLLRRWRHASGARPVFVGLSATLRDAKRFFARLTSLPESLVDEVAPVTHDLETVGMEYQLALRSDPVSGASVLATTIQTAMLLGRTMTPAEDDCPGNIYGKRVFAFTDNLDVTNRLYYQLMDAEGLNSVGQPFSCQYRPEGSLATLRRSSLPSHARRFLLGQSWDLSEAIGHSLQPGAHLRIGRTSSQDVGVSDTADLIVATASLEVGFNDPRVGAVLQHKAPKDVAQFLQRKGRAGRDPRMRPWTVVVLSAYGRDRLAYQGYDLLFDPELPPRNLPVENRYVLRMQAVYAFMDWMADRLNGMTRGSVWHDFTGPARWEGGRRRQQRAVQIIAEVLQTPEARATLAEYLQRALQIDSSLCESLFWDPPRPLLTAVLPTLLRRLDSSWSRRGVLGRDRIVRNNPLPEFIPSNLFSELNLPEVLLILNRPGNNGAEDEACLGILQAMQEFAPGRVSKRYAVRGKSPHWIPPGDLESAVTGQLDIDLFCPEFEELGVFTFEDGGVLEERGCLQPCRYVVETPPKSIKETSNSRLDWRTQIVPSGDGLVVELPATSAWEGVLERIRFFTHNQHSHLEMRRFAVGAVASLKLASNQEQELRLAFVHNNKPVALGYSLQVDGVAITYRVPGDLVDRSFADPELSASLRTARFRDLVRTDDGFPESANIFRRDWLSQVYLAALTTCALEQKIDLSAASREIQAGGNVVYNSILDVIFQSVAQTDEGGNGEDPERHRQRTQQVLTDLFGTPEVLDRLHELATVLWAPADDAWQPWLAARFKATLGTAIFDAVQGLCPDFDSDELILDLAGGPMDLENKPTAQDLDTVWITETNPGGGGFVEELLARYGEDPRRFLALMESALENSEFEIMDRHLTALLTQLMDLADSHLRNVVAELRAARTHAAQGAAFQKLLRRMTEKGLAISHPVLVALHARILRPGSTPETDALLYDLIRGWKDCERRLGIEVDAHCFAYVASRDQVGTVHALDQALGGLGSLGAGQDLAQWRYGTIYGLLWPRGLVARAQSLVVRNPFQGIPLPERQLVRRYLRLDVAVVSLDAMDWEAQAAEHVARDGAVVLRVSESQAQRLKAAMLRMVTIPSESGFLLLYPRLRGMRNENGNLEVLFESSEVLPCRMFPQGN